MAIVGLCLFIQKRNQAMRILYRYAYQFTDPCGRSTALKDFDHGYWLSEFYIIPASRFGGYENITDFHKAAINALKTYTTRAREAEEEIHLAYVRETVKEEYDNENSREGKNPHQDRTSLIEALISCHKDLQECEWELCLLELRLPNTSHRNFSPAPTITA